MTLKNIYIFGLVIFLTGCGTYSPIPSHGGGKRFAVEQALVSSAMRRAISEIPVDRIKNKKVLFETTIVNDEGGGYLSGGRPYANEVISAQRTRLSGGDVASQLQSIVGINVVKNDTIYTKDISFNNSDAKQFTNLLASYLARNNVMLNPVAETEGEPDYFLEVIVDVLGSWRSRTDWLIANRENLSAIVSLEYVITPMQNNEGERLVGRIGYESTYSEKYWGWIGPVESGLNIKKKNFDDYIGVFGVGIADYGNLRRGKPVDYKPADAAQPVMINPRGK